MNTPDGQARLRDGSVVKDRRLGRLISFDERSRNFPVTALLAKLDKTEPRSYTWKITNLLDQGREGACVAAAWTHELMARPAVIGNLDMDFARKRIYWPAQQIDEWPGGSYDQATPFYEGTSVLAGAKIVKDSLKGIGAYYWAFNVKDFAAAVSRHGPGVIGVAWKDGMFSPRPSGLLEVTGDIAGGHAVCVFGYRKNHKLPGEDKARNLFAVAQSWGADHGVDGVVYIDEEDFGALIHDRDLPGEMCIAQLRRRTLEGEAG